MKVNTKGLVIAFVHLGDVLVSTELMSNSYFSYHAKNKRYFKALM